MGPAVAVSLLLHAAFSLWWWQRAVPVPAALPSRFDVVLQPAPQSRPMPSRPRTVLPPNPEPVKPAPAKRPPRRKAAKPAPDPVPEPSPEPKPVPVSKPAPRLPTVAPVPEPSARAVATAAEKESASPVVPVLMPPRPVSGPDNPLPWYPRLARRRGMEGRVVLRVTVDPQGRAAAVVVVESSGYRLLDDAARQTVMRWRFEPARRGGRPVTAEVRVPIRFRLRDGGVRRE